MSLIWIHFDNPLANSMTESHQLVMLKTAIVKIYKQPKMDFIWIALEKWFFYFTPTIIVSAKKVSNDANDAKGKQFSFWILLIPISIAMMFWICRLTQSCS